VAAASEAKHALASQGSAVVSVERVELGARPFDLRYRIDGEHYAALCRPILERVAGLWRRVAGSLNGRTLVVGGVARLPFVQPVLAELLGRNVEIPAAPDEAVALGTALRAAG
jgi:molecular chaperone DnaK (HSP70)